MSEIRFGRLVIGFLSLMTFFSISAGITEAEPTEEQRNGVRQARARSATDPITGKLNTLLEDIRKRQEQVIDDINPDKVVTSDWDENTAAKRTALVQQFSEWMDRPC